MQNFKIFIALLIVFTIIISGVLIIFNFYGIAGIILLFSSTFISTALVLFILWLITD